MNRKVTLLCMLLLLLFASVLSVQAHSGGTDGEGGHRNSSTGEYHYHHGFPAHQHYDMNGDGVADCPYEFVDNTDQHNDSADSNSVVNNGSTPEMPTITNTTTEKPSFSNILSRIFLCIIALMIIPCLSFILVIVPNPVTWLIGKLSKLSKDEDTAYKHWFFLIIAIADIFAIYKIFTLK